MDKILIILSFVFLTSCGPKELTSDQLVERQGAHYEVNSTTPFTGVVVDYHDNGQLEWKTNIKDREKEGLREWYYETGQLSIQSQKLLALYPDPKKFSRRPSL